MITAGETYEKDSPKDDPQLDKSPSKAAIVGDKSLGKVIVNDPERDRQWQQDKIKALESELKECDRQRDLLRLQQIKRHQQEELKKELQRQANFKRKEAYEHERDALKAKIHEAEVQLTQAKKVHDETKTNDLNSEIKELKGRLAGLDRQRLEDIDALNAQETERQHVSKMAIADEMRKQIELESRRIEIENELDELRSDHKIVWRSYTPLSSMKKVPTQDRVNRSNEVHSFTERSLNKDSGNSTWRNVIGVIAAILFIILIALILHYFIFSRPTIVHVPVHVENAKPAAAYSPGFYTKAHNVGTGDLNQSDYSRRFEDMILSSSDTRPVTYSPLIVPASLPSAGYQPNQAVNIQTNTSGNNGNPSTSTTLNSSANSNVNTLVNSNTQQNTTEEHKNTVNVIPVPVTEKTIVIPQQSGSPLVVNNYNHPVQHSKVTKVHHHDDQSKTVMAKDIKNVKMGTENTNIMNQASHQSNINIPTTINQTNTKPALDTGITQPAALQTEEKGPEDIKVQKEIPGEEEPVQIPISTDKPTITTPSSLPDIQTTKNQPKKSNEQPIPPSTSIDITEQPLVSLEEEKEKQPQLDTKVIANESPITKKPVPLEKSIDVIEKTEEDNDQKPSDLQGKSDLEKIEGITESKIGNQSLLKKDINHVTEKIVVKHKKAADEKPKDQKETVQSLEEEPQITQPQQELTSVDNKNPINQQKQPITPIEESKIIEPKDAKKNSEKDFNSNQTPAKISDDLSAGKLNISEIDLELKLPAKLGDKDQLSPDQGQTIPKETEVVDPNIMPSDPNTKQPKIDPKTGKPIVKPEKPVDEFNPLTGEVIEPREEQKKNDIVEQNPLNPDAILETIDKQNEEEINPVNDNQNEEEKKTNLELNEGDAGVSELLIGESDPEKTDDDTLTASTESDPKKYSDEAKLESMYEENLSKVNNEGEEESLPSEKENKDEEETNLNDDEINHLQSLTNGEVPENIEKSEEELLKIKKAEKKKRQEEEKRRKEEEEELERKKKEEEEKKKKEEEEKKKNSLTEPLKKEVATQTETISNSKQRVLENEAHNRFL